MGVSVKVTVVGLFPTFYSMVATCCTYDYAAYTGDKESQISEYPSWVLENYKLLLRIVKDLSKFEDSIKLEVVGLDSLKGVLLALRYRLNKEVSIIVGDRVFRGPVIDMNEVFSEIERLQGGKVRK